MDLFGRLVLMLELSPKQRYFLKESTARLNFLVGSVRSGKTYVSIVRWLDFIQNAPKGNLAIIGRTASTIKRNIIDEICNLVGADAHHYIGKNELSLWGRRIYLIAGNDARAEGKLRGITLAGALADEATLLPESFFTMLLSRLSVPNAKLFGTTNPDSPYHWLKTDFLDREEELDLKHFHFNLEDNPSLTEEFKDNLKKEYRGLWYKRYIEGHWVLAEGAIFDFFDEKLHTIEYAPHAQGKYFVGVDYGTSNPTAFVMVGYNARSYPNVWVEKEYYWDPKDKLRQKTDSEFAEDLKSFIQEMPTADIYIDPSAASFKAELMKVGIRNVLDADNDVLNGIRFVSDLLTNGTLKVCKSCTNLIKEIQGYTWDPKAQMKGEDKPIKTRDHACDGLRYSLFTGIRPILAGSGMLLDDYRKLKSNYYGSKTLGEVERSFRW